MGSNKQKTGGSARSRNHKIEAERASSFRGEDKLPIGDVNKVLTSGRWLSEITGDLFGSEFGIEFKPDGQAIFWMGPCNPNKNDTYRKQFPSSYSVSGSSVAIRLSGDAMDALSRGEKSSAAVLRARLLDRKTLYIIDEIPFYKSSLSLFNRDCWFDDLR